jgi:hypothetical protein
MNADSSDFSFSTRLSQEDCAECMAPTGHHTEMRVMTSNSSMSFLCYTKPLYPPISQKSHFLEQVTENQNRKLTVVSSMKNPQKVVMEKLHFRQNVFTWGCYTTLAKIMSCNQMVTDSQKVSTEHQ